MGGLERYSIEKIFWTDQIISATTAGYYHHRLSPKVSVLFLQLKQTGRSVYDFQFLHLSKNNINRIKNL